MAFYIKRGDTSPSILMKCEDGQGNAVDISDASARFHMSRLGSSVAKVDAPASIIDAANGLVRYDWVSDDTDTSGPYWCEVEVSFLNGDVETFPNNSYERIDIKDDLA